MKAFVTVGLERKPFHRLLNWVDQAVEQNLLSSETMVQQGHTVFPASRFKTVDFLPFNEIVDAIKNAELVISHAGVGSILLTLNSGKIPLVVPRQGTLGEHVDNHQIEFAEVMVATRKIKAAFNEDDFYSLLRQAKQWNTQLAAPVNPVSGLNLSQSLKNLCKEIENFKNFKAPDEL